MFRNCSCSASADLFRHDSIRWRPAARQARFPVFLCLRQDNDMNKTVSGISPEVLKNCEESFRGDRANLVAANASVKNGFLEAATDYAALQKLPYTFNIDLKQGSVTNQKSSGRCWLFAALNIFRYEIIHRYDLEDFELSQNYLFFYDKLERSNYYLETMIDLVEEPLDGRLLSFLNRDPIGDGGQWDMMANLVRKYGVVPKYAYPDGANSISSRQFNQYLTTLLRQFGAALRGAHQSGAGEDALREMKNAQMESVYRVLAIALGEPPKTFDLVMKDKKNRVIEERGLDGVTFFRKYTGIQIDDYVSLINAPTEDKPMNKTYTIRHLGNVAEGRDICYLNLPVEQLKAAAIAQMRDGHPVWFGSDCMQFALRPEAVFDRASTNVESLVNVRYLFSKGERLTYCDSAMDHAMVFLGVNVDPQGKPERWRIENSWGKESGPNGGYYIASDSWFDDFVYQIAINRKYLSEETRALLDSEPLVLEPWDPMGTLAD